MSSVALRAGGGGLWTQGIPSYHGPQTTCLQHGHHVKSFSWSQWISARPSKLIGISPGDHVVIMSQLLEQPR